MQYNCQKSSNFQGLSHFSRISGKNDKIPGFFQAGKTVTIFPGFPGAVGTLNIVHVPFLGPTKRGLLQSEAGLQLDGIRHACTIRCCMLQHNVFLTPLMLDLACCVIALQCLPVKFGVITGNPLNDIYLNVLNTCATDIAELGICTPKNHEMAPKK